MIFTNKQKSCESTSTESHADEDSDPLQTIELEKKFRIHVHENTSIEKISTALISQNIEKGIQLLPKKIERCDFLLLDDTEMIRLHKKWHNKSSSTDVLTFYQKSNPIEADIALCVTEARKKNPKNIEKELTLYAIHGLLHCCGFNDTTEQGFIAMHEEEDRIGKAIGLGPLYYTKEFNNDS